MMAVTNDAIAGGSRDEPARRNETRHFPVGHALLRSALGGAGRSIKAVDGVTFRIRRGETFSLVGESGCGKSTLARVIAGLDAPTTGTITLCRRRGVESQDTDDLPGSLRVAQSALSGRHGHRRSRSAFRSCCRRSGDAARARAATPRRAGAGRRDEVSRTNFPAASASASRLRARSPGNPTFLVCDEPTSSLDVSVQAQILNLLRRLQQELGLTCLFISHNLAVINYVSHDVGVMYLGRLAEVAPTRVLFEAPKHPYTRLLLAALPRLDTRGRDPPPDHRRNPESADPPSGCAFHPRCPHANARRRDERPGASRRRRRSEVACHAVSERRIRGHAPPTLSALVNA